jgi:ATP-dependent DNA helicase Rep
LSTIHAAKGLEYPHVFIAGVEEGLLPHYNDDAPDDEARIQEERRLMYVAVTRAQRSLQLTWCKQRKRAGAMNDRQASRFLVELQGAPQVLEPSESTTLSPKDRIARLQSLLKKNGPASS